MQLDREYQLLKQQDIADKRKLRELQSMSEDFENGGDKTNFKDVRPESTRSKQSSRMGSQGNLKPTPS